ncbi:MAG: excinuclease ABC subunit UvrC [Desulfovibrionaceae bacterium]|nr:excinuclease ABC subunit UvrC [Desulfovibrionaceae bacterium]
MSRPPLDSLSELPGVYLYKDAVGTVVYVGKASNLRRRILSYFRDDIPPKTEAMLRCARNLETIITRTEKEALILEAELIRRYRPHYNILLKDGGRYCLFRIGTDAFPRLEIVRRAGRDGASYFGPFPSASSAAETLKTVRALFPMRRCSDRSFRNRVRPCLYYHMGRCPAPCAGMITEEQYAETVRSVTRLLSGRTKDTLHVLHEYMEKASDELDFEKAAVFRDRIRAVEATAERQSVLFHDGRDVDAIGIARIAEGLGLGLLSVRDGCLIDARTFFFPGLSTEDSEDLVGVFLRQFYMADDTPQPPSKILVPWFPGSEEESVGVLEDALSDRAGFTVRIAMPGERDEISLVDMAERNAAESAALRKNQDLAGSLARLFGTNRPIERIECVDISHTGGRNTRAGMVVFEQGRPVKESWRNYRIDGADGDDFAALAMWAERRCREAQPMPDLLLIDGGKGQISSVERVFRDCDGDRPHILAGIAKARTEDGRSDRRAGNTADRIFVSGRVNALPFRDGSKELLYLQHIRDTAHHFAIGRHREARGHAVVQSELLRIPGIGPAAARRLWDHFSSVEAMIAATEDELRAIPGIGARRAAELASRLASWKQADFSGKSSRKSPSVRGWKQI